VRHNKKQDSFEQFVPYDESDIFLRNIEFPKPVFPRPKKRVIIRLNKYAILKRLNRLIKFTDRRKNFFLNNKFLRLFVKKVPLLKRRNCRNRSVSPMIKYG
jgi:hypothetical protein